MPLHFVDRHGIEGWIYDDLSIAYVGPDEVADSIHRCVDEVESDERATRDAHQSLLIDLPVECPVREVERVEERYADD